MDTNVAAELDRPDQLIAEETEGGPAHHSRVLVVDDEELVRRAITRALGPAGFEVIEADDANAALAAADHIEGGFYIAIIDRQMPDMDGLAVVKQLKSALGARLHAVVLSGLREQDQRLEAFDAGADDFVAKPFSAAELVERVRAARRTQLALAALAAAQERAERLRLYAAEAGALLAHDLNNGLAIALGNLEFLNDTATALNEDEADALASSVRALRRMASLVSNFTDVGRLEDGALQPRCTSVPVSELLRTLASVHTPASGLGPKIEVSCPESLSGWFDPILVERILHNLLGNALRYVEPRGFVKIVARREESGDGGPMTGRLVLEVINSGQAIPEEIQRRLFQKYGVGTDRRSSRGLGLYFCRLASEAHGGTISVHSTGSVTAFTVRLPVPAAAC